MRDKERSNTMTKLRDDLLDVLHVFYERWSDPNNGMTEEEIENLALSAIEKLIEKEVDKAVEIYKRTSVEINDALAIKEKELVEVKEKKK